VPGLRDFETLGGSIEKIETSMVELKIAANFMRINSTYSQMLITSLIGINYFDLCQPCAMLLIIEFDIADIDSLMRDKNLLQISF
jgi:hypothetical protein